MSKRLSPSENSPLLTGCGVIHNGGEAIRGDGDSEAQKAHAVDDRTTFQLLFIMSGPWICCFLSALDMTIIATLSASISESFNSLSMVPWIASAYLIANSAIQPISGRLTDIFSRKTGMISSAFLLALGNLVCGLARSPWELIFGRAVAGIGGGGIAAISTILGSDIIPLRKRGLWQGIGNIIYGSGAALGAIVGGWINDTWSWRAAFLPIVPLVFLSGLLMLFTMPSSAINEEAQKSAWERIDYLGASLIVSTLVLLSLGLSSGGEVVPWTHPFILVSLSSSIISFALFIYVEIYHAAEAIIPLHLMLNRTVISACMTNWFGAMTYFSILFYGPIYFQVTGLSATQAGLRLVPSSVGLLFGSITVGVIMRWTGRYYFLSVVTHAVRLIGLLIISTFTLTSRTWESILSFFLLGLGYSSMLTILLTAVLSAVDQQYQAVATSALYAFRGTGSTIGITISSVVFQNMLDKQLWALLGDLRGGDEVISRVKNNLGEIQNLPHGWKELVMGAYMNALRGVFLATLALGILGMLTSLVMRENVLRTSLARK